MRFLSSVSVFTNRWCQLLTACTFAPVCLSVCASVRSRPGQTNMLQHDATLAIFRRYASTLLLGWLHVLWPKTGLTTVAEGWISWKNNYRKSIELARQLSCSSNLESNQSNEVLQPLQLNQRNEAISKLWQSDLDFVSTTNMQLYTLWLCFPSVPHDDDDWLHLRTQSTLNAFPIY